MISVHKFLIVFVVTLILSVPVMYTQETAVYVIVQQTQPTVIEVVLLPAEPQGEVNTQVIPVPELWFLAEAYGSPTASTIALVFRNGVNYAISTYDLASKSLTTIADNVVLPPPGFTLMARKQDIAFSPDGRYLSYNSANPSGTQQGTTIYDFVNADQWQLNTGAGFTSQLAWSPDGERLAVVVTDCQTTCSASLQIHSVSMRELMQTIRISETIRESATIENTGVCQLAWSPDSQHLSFMATCGRSNYAYNKEIYLVAPQSGQIIRITDFTYTQERIPPLDAVLGEYVTAWLSADELIISAQYGSGDGTRATFIYNVESQQSTILSNVYYSAIDAQPATGRVLLQPSLNDDFQVQSPIDVLAITTQGEQVVRIESETNDASILGCNPDFSPSGQNFVVKLSQSEGCGSRVTELQIWLTGKDLALVRTMSFSTEVSAIPIGWVTLSGTN